MPSKKEYVAKQIQTRDHTCHWPNCTRQVPPAMWGCKIHWTILPKKIRDNIWENYRPRQEIDMKPSDAYLVAVKAAQDWIAKYLTGEKMT